MFVYICKSVELIVFWAACVMSLYAEWRKQYPSATEAAHDRVIGLTLLREP